MKFRARDDTAEMVWRGRAHIGDDPGVYGDASYGGLALEFPVTLTRYPDSGDSANVTFVVSAEDSTSFGAPYPGHQVTVFAVVAATEPPLWEKLPVGHGVIGEGKTSIPTELEGDVRYVTVRVEVDLSVPPGNNDDFVLTGLSLLSDTHYADFGFRG